MSNQLEIYQRTQIAIEHDFVLDDIEMTYKEDEGLVDYIKEKTTHEVETYYGGGEATITLRISTLENWQCVQDWIAEVETAIKAYLVEIRPALEL